MSPPVNLLLYWGKTDQDNKARINLDWHPAILHMIDVGASFVALSDDVFSPRIFRNMAKELGISISQTKKWLSFLIALHDLGKISPGFQKMVQELCFYKNDPEHPVTDFDTGNRAGEHALVSNTVMRGILPLYGFSNIHADQIATGVAAHHGDIPAGHPTRDGKGQWIVARQMAIDYLKEIFGVTVNVRPKSDEFSGQFLALLMGFTSISDWVGSNADFFKLTCNDSNIPLSGDLNGLKNYYQNTSLPTAKKAVVDLGWTKWKDRPVRRKEFNTLFFSKDGIGLEPNEMQKIAGVLAQKAKGRQFLQLIEAPMGEGKTEAAFWATLCSGRLRNGIYNALPTMATSNQMLGRFASFLKNVFPTKDNIHLHLAHSMACLDSTYCSFAKHYKFHRIYGVYKDSRIDAHSWFSKSKTRLLAPFAVGTIDQALLGSLFSKFFFVRLVGLFGKTIILDEVHAYDTFTSRILDRLLHWLAALECNVILLSATLPANRRKQLMEAFAGENIKHSTCDYPRISMVTLPKRGKAKSQSIHIKCSEKKTMMVKKLSGRLPAINLLAEKIQGGGCATLICNTVKRAQETFDSIHADPRFNDVSLVLLHAKFPIYRRKALETGILSRFGKDISCRPEKAIIVATQVIEQSLDIDFDLMISELCPIDLMLQRPGRMHRFLLKGLPSSARPDAMRIPAIYWIDPDADDLDLSSKIYDKFLLELTSKILRKRKSISLPEDMDELIELVYGNIEIKDPVLQALSDIREMNNTRKTLKASEALLPVSYKAQDILKKCRIDDDDEMTANTRDDEYPTTGVICLHQVGKDHQIIADPTGPIPDGLGEKLDWNGDEKYWRKMTPKVFEGFVRVPVYWLPEGLTCPKEWEENQILKSCRTVVFSNGIADGKDGRIRSDVHRGLWFEKK